MLDLQREDVVFALDAISAPVSLYDPIYSDGGDCVRHGPGEGTTGTPTRTG